MGNYTRVQWNTAVTGTFNLPNIGYPVPVDAYDDILAGGGEIDFASMLYWLQEYSAGQKEGWEELEPAMLRLAEILAPEDLRDRLTAQGDNWFLEIGSIDPDATLVTIQRGDALIAAIAPREDFRLRVAIYRPPDAKAIGYLLDLGQIPHPEYGIAMRANNWEYTLDHANHDFAAAMACERGESYLSYWQYGLGVYQDGSRSSSFYDLRDQAPMLPSRAMIQLGVYYELYPEDD
jgi:hypothetical protein